MRDIFGEFVATLTLAIAVFAIALCFTRKQYKHVTRAFALFLVSVFINNLPSATHQLLLAADARIGQLSLFAIEMLGGLSLAPSFWLYVAMLTSDTSKLPHKFYLHFLLPAFALFFLPINPMWPVHLEQKLFAQNFDGADPWLLAYGILAGILSLITFPQLAFYICLVFRRLIRYRARLKDIYASTEEYELNWIVVIGLLAVLFWLTQLIALFFLSTLQPYGVLSAVYNGLAFVLFFVVTMWGLRLTPHLLPRSNELTAAAISSQKYDKSALSDRDADRIEKKLRAAMEKQRLYRDPNLSLWKLTQHIGASPNYISQTLNEVVGQNFFDFVNAYRIEEAKAMLVMSDETILNIAYEVGFNSRSSFYTAFKKTVGKTPSSYRESVRMR